MTNFRCYKILHETMVIYIYNMHCGFQAAQRTTGESLYRAIHEYNSKHRMPFRGQNFLRTLVLEPKENITIHHFQVVVMCSNTVIW